LRTNPEEARRSRYVAIERPHAIVEECEVNDEPADLEALRSDADRVGQAGIVGCRGLRLRGPTRPSRSLSADASPPTMRWLTPGWRARTSSV
jgi:hypothetical protein